MKAVVCCGGNLEVTDIPAPEPQAGQVLLNVSRAGICGSDVHLRSSLDHFAAAAAAAIGDGGAAQSDTGVVFGHEFSGEVADYGSGTNRRWKPGTLMVAMPLCRHGRHPHIVGTSPDASGSFAEQMVVQESVAFAVPNGLSADHAALTEPMAVAWHAVQRSQIRKGQTAYVIGCGPIGMAVIAFLKVKGVHCIVASDPSPRRRDLAKRCGADVVIDPQLTDPFAAAPPPSRTTRVAGISFPNAPWAVPGNPDDMNLGFDAMEKLRRFALVPWWQLFRAMHRFDSGPLGPVVFECVGVPGMLDRLITDAPVMSRIVVVGACLEPDTIRPISAIIKEVDLRFSVGYNPGEFRDTLHMLADGKVDPTPFLTGTVGFHGVDAAFNALGKPEEHAKVLIDPHSSATTL